MLACVVSAACAGLAGAMLAVLPGEILHGEFLRRDATDKVVKPQRVATRPMPSRRLPFHRSCRTDCARRCHNDARDDTAPPRQHAAEAAQAAHTLENAERPPVNQQPALHLAEGRSRPVILLLRERCGQVLPEPVEMLADDPADLLVARGPMPGVRRLSAGRARHARQRRHPECLFLISKQPGPGSQIVKELIEHRVEGVRLGNPSVSLLHIQKHVDDLAEHLVEGGGRIVAPGRAHAGTEAGRRPAHAQGSATGSRHPTRGTSLL